jgi:hypothetical protein
MPMLENWSVGAYTSSPYNAPELKVRCLAGEIHDDDRFPAGKKIRTSELEFLCTKTGRAVTASGTVYILGKPCAEWEAWLKENNYELSEFDLDRIPKL